MVEWRYGHNQGVPLADMLGGASVLALPGAILALSECYGHSALDSTLVQQFWPGD